MVKLGSTEERHFASTDRCENIRNCKERIESGRVEDGETQADLGTTFCDDLASFTLMP